MEAGSEGGCTAALSCHISIRVVDEVGCLAIEYLNRGQVCATVANDYPHYKHQLTERENRLQQTCGTPPIESKESAMARLGRCFAAGLVVAAVAGAAGRADETRLPETEVLELNLRNALFQTAEPTGRDADLILELERIDGQWQLVIGIAREYNVSLHLGYVKQAVVDGQFFELEIGMRIAADSWTPGGPAQYRVQLARKADGRLEGTYDGTFKGKKVTGEATGTMFLQQNVMGKDFVPVQPGEHPRTVFRRGELPKLREKLKTPFGRAVFEEMDGPVGWGVQYQLTGDKKYAELARREVAEIVFKGKGCSAAFAPARALGVQVERVAVSLDLCFDAWPDDFKMQVITWLRKIATRVFTDGRKISESANWNVASNHVGSLYAGVAFAGLVLWGEKGPEPPEPTPPALEVDIPAAADFQPGRGVPVLRMEPGVVPRNWLATQVLSEAIATDPLASVQGLESLRPEAGTTIQLDQFKLTFRLLESKYVVAAENNLDIKAMMNNLDTASFCLYTVLDVREPGLYKLYNPYSNSGRPVLILNGQRIAHEQVVRLEKGLYPVLVLARILTVWGKFQPHFERASEQELAASQELHAREEIEYEARLAEWEVDMAEWKRLGGIDVEYYKLFRTGRRIMYLLYREAVGTGGFQAEVAHYNKDTTDGPNRYATAFRHCFGYDVSPFPDMTHYLTRNAFVYVYPDGGKPWAQDINGSVRIGGRYFAALFPIVPHQWKPAMLWAWNRIEGVTDDASRVNAVLEDPAWGFVNYPLDMQPKPPAGVLPLTWEAPDFGFCAFRNGWRGGDDVITQVFLKAHHIGGWNGPNAGTFRIAGLGKTWAVGPDGRERRRWNESVVWLPGDDHYESALGRLMHLETDKDGSGVVGIDLNDIYSMRPERGTRLYTLYGGKRNDWAFRPSGISGMRSFGVDYSGKCGAPALFAVVDKIQGGKDKVWLWQVPRVSEDRDSKMAEITIAGNMFTIHQGDATLTATFVTPSPVKITAGTRAMKIKKSAGHMAGKILDVTFDAVFAEGGNEFFVVATLQRGAPPPVKIEGKGLGAKARVGRQTVRFDGEKIAFGR